MARSTRSTPRRLVSATPWAWSSSGWRTSSSPAGRRPERLLGQPVKPGCATTATAACGRSAVMPPTSGPPGAVVDGVVVDGSVVGVVVVGGAVVGGGPLVEQCDTTNCGLPCVGVNVADA